MENLVESTRLISMNEPSTALSLSINDPETDMEVRVDTKEIKVHKLVVKDCPFFAAIIDGNWIESRTSVVTLNG